MKEDSLSQKLAERDGFAVKGETSPFLVTITTTVAVEARNAEDAIHTALGDKSDFTRSVNVKARLAYRGHKY